MFNGRESMNRAFRGRRRPSSRHGLRL